MPYTLTQLQSLFYQDTCELYERSRDIAAGTPQDEGWELIDTDIPYLHESTDNINEHTAVGEGVKPSLLTTDHGHYPVGVPLLGTPGHTAGQMIRNTTPDSPKNGWYSVLGPVRPIPSLGPITANKVIVMLRAVEFAPDVDGAALTAGELAAGTVAQTSVTLGWAAAVDGVGPYLYAVRFRLTGDLDWIDWEETLGLESTVTGLTAGTAYDFLIAPTDQLGAAAESNIVSITTPAPLTVTLSVTGADSGSISLSAAVHGGTGPYSLQFQYKRSTSSTWLDSGTAGTATTNTVSGLAASTFYDEQVVVTDALGGTATSTITGTETNAGWHPGQISGAVYYEPTSGVFTDTAATTPAGTGDPIGCINDWGAGANHSEQATAAARPTLVSVGGKPGVQFDGVDDFLATIANVPLGDAQTMFCAYKLNALGATVCVMGNAYSGTNGLALLVNSSSQLATSARTVGVDTATVTEDGTTLRYLVTQRSGAFTDVIRRGGVSVGGSPNSVTIGTANMPLETGRLSGSAALQFSGVLFGWGAMPASISLSDRNLLEAYLAALIA